MRKLITLSTFRKVARAEDGMMRAMMPRTSAEDATPFAFASDRRVVIAAAGGTRLAQRLTYNLAEVAHV